MPTSTKPIAGYGVILSIGDTPTPVGQVIGIKQSGRKNDTEDVTSLSSTSHEFIGGVPDSGQYDISGFYAGSDAGQVALEAAFATAALTNFTITYPKTTGQTTSGDKFAFSAIVTEKNNSIDGKAIKFDAKLKVSGGITFTAGA